MLNFIIFILSVLCTLFLISNLSISFSLCNWYFILMTLFLNFENFILLIMLMTVLVGIIMFSYYYMVGDYTFYYLFLE